MNNKMRTRLVKGDKLRFISHLDLLSTINRALRRAKLPIAYSQGYNPTPNVSFASALAVGLTSDSEYIDFELEGEISADIFQQSLNKVLPAGLEIFEAELVTFKTKSLMAVIDEASYLARLELFREATLEELRKEVEQFLAQTEIIIRRKRRKKKDRVFDIKEMISRLELLGVQGQLATITMLLSTGSSGNLRPEEVINGLADFSELVEPAKLVNIHRSGLYIREGDKLLSPIETVVKGN